MRWACSSAPPFRQVVQHALLRPEDVDEALLDYMRAILPYDEAQAPIARDEPPRSASSISTSGRSGRYGWYSCHEVAGF